MALDFISKHFPLPKFLKPPHIGISFSDSGVEAIMFDKSFPGKTLHSMIVPLPKGAIVAGVIVEEMSVLKALSQIREKFDTSFVFFTLPDEISYIYSLTIPLNSSNNLTESVAFTIEENVPLSLLDTVFDFIPIKITESDTTKEASLVVVACVKKELEKFVRILRQSGFEPVGSLHESQVLALALVSGSGTFCIVHARRNRVGIYLVVDRVVYFVTIRSITEGNYGKEFLDEYEKFIEYCLKFGEQGKSIDSVLVCGEFEFAKLVVMAISKSTLPKLDVKLGNVWTNVLKIEKNGPSISYEDSLNLAGPIGAVLSDIV